MLGKMAVLMPQPHQPEQQDPDTLVMSLLLSVIQVGLSAQAAHDQNSQTRQILTNRYRTSSISLQQ